MYHRNGTLVARYPHFENMIGRNFKTGAASQQQVFDLPQRRAEVTGWRAVGPAGSQPPGSPHGGGARGITRGAQ